MTKPAWALRCSRPYKTAFDHDKTIDILIRGDDRTQPAHFDPDILKAFFEISDRFAEIYASREKTIYGQAPNHG